MTKSSADEEHGKDAERIDMSKARKVYASDADLYQRMFPDEECPGHDWEDRGGGRRRCRNCAMDDIVSGPS